MPKWAETLIWIAGVITAVGIIGRAIQLGGRWVRRTWRKLDRLADELLGEPAREDRPARPSLMQRVAALDRRLAAVEAEMRPNGGSSVKDQLNRIEDQLG